MRSDVTHIIHICAGDYAQARFYANELGYDPTQWRYVANVEILRGLTGGTIYFRGTWYEHPDAVRIEEQAVMNRMTLK